MENWESFIKKLVELMGFSDYTVEVDVEHNHATIFIHDDHTLIKEHLPLFVESVNYVMQLVARRFGSGPIFVDINNYRKERENLIVELVRATTRRVVATGHDMPLPAMNSYERRLVHMELASHPNVTTESVGKGHSRYVVIKPIQGAPAILAHAENTPTPADMRPTSFDEIIRGIQEIT